MKTETSIKILENIDTFIDVLYYDGIKLQVDIENYNLLVWYDYEETFEKWFYLKSNEKKFKLYISNKITLLELFKNSEVFFVIRDYENYDILEDVTLINDLNEYKLPSEKSFLGFNFTAEKEYRSYLFKGFRKKLSYSQRAISNKKRVKPSQRQQYSNFNQTQVEWRIHVAA